MYQEGTLSFFPIKQSIFKYQEALLDQANSFLNLTKKDGQNQEQPKGKPPWRFLKKICMLFC